MRDNNLIIDVGMHVGNDTEFYLRKGFRVASVEANPSVVKEAIKRFSKAIEQKKLIIYQTAVAEHEGEVDFYLDDAHSDRGTTSKGQADYGRQLGYPSHLIRVPSRTFGSILEESGIPYYLKIDIEGADVLCLRALFSFEEKPLYISVEAGVTSFYEGFEKLSLLFALGYRGFKIVNQANLSKIRCPDPPREGMYVDARFGDFSSGPFGEETPGQWADIEKTIKHYHRILCEQSYFGAHGTLYRSLVHRAYEKITRKPVGWYDFHARLAPA